MNKLLLTTAIVGLGFAATPALADGHSDGFNLTAGGFFKGYVSFLDQDEVAGGTEARDVDIVRHTEVYLQGEKEFDNGLTVGVYIEGEADEDDSFEIEESYVYFQGDWGRINFGAEDGAAYLLQVAAPSADENVDGIRQFISPISTAALPVGAAGLPANIVAQLGSDEGGLDYDNDLSQEDENKITYLTPVFSGFQFGVSYTPEITSPLVNNEDGEVTDGGLTGNGADDQAGEFGDVVDLAIRWEGDFDGIGVQLGAGYSVASLEAAAPAAGAGLQADDDRSQYNVAANVNLAGFTLGAVFTEDDHGEGEHVDETTYVIGASFETGAFKVGASYLDTSDLLGYDGVDAQRVAGGVTYTYGPGLSFRGSIGYVEFDNDGTFGGAGDLESTYVLLGTQVNF